MAEEKTRNNTCSGALFENNRKEKPAQPDMTGPFDVRLTCPHCEKDISQKLRMAGWWKEDRKDKTRQFLSLSGEPKEDEPK